MMMILLTRFIYRKREDVGIKHLNDPKSFMEHSACMDDVYNILMITTQQEKEKI